MSNILAVPAKYTVTNQNFRSLRSPSWFELRQLGILLLLAVAACLSLISTASAAAPEQISIQLKWKHSFQFAGYYAAIEKGYYRDAGLDVSLKQIDLQRDLVDQVLAGESEYGTFDSGLLAHHLQQQPVVLVNQIFQHNPLVFIAKRDSGVASPYDMIGKRVALDISSFRNAPLIAMLSRTLGDLSRIQQQPLTEASYQALIDDKVDVVPAYSTSQPFMLGEQGIDINIIDPQSYGIDFYGDNLFTSQQELEEHPERVKRVSEATIKGWRYALEHPEEIIRLIREKYAPQLSDSFLRQEAIATREMIHPEMIDLGTVDPKRYQRIAHLYQRLGITDTSEIQKRFFYQPAQKTVPVVSLTQEERTWLGAHPVIAVGGGPDWAPFDFVDSNGNYAGIANDYLNLIAEKTGLRFDVRIDTWDNQLRKLRDKQVDLLGAAYYTSERDKYATYSTPYFEVIDYFFVRDDLQANTLEDLNDHRVAVPKSYAQIETLKRYFPEIEIIEVDSFDEAVDAVLEGRAEILYDAYATLSHKLQRDGINTIVPFKSSRQTGRYPIHIITRNDQPELASIVQKGLDAITSREKHAINNRWLGTSPGRDAATLALTEEERQWLRDHPTIRLRVDSDWPPYEFIDNKGEPQGLGIDVARMIERRLGVEFETVEYGWTEALAKARSRDVDMISNIARTAKREEYLRFSDVYIAPKYAVFTRKDSAPISDMDDLSQRTVVIENQFYLHEVLQRDYPQIKLLVVETTTDALRTLSFGQADAYIGNQGTANWIAEKYVLTNLKIAHVPPELGASELRFAVRQDWPVLQQLLNKALASIPDIEMQQVRRKWLGITAEPAGPVLSAEERRWLKQHPTVRFTGDPNWLPYEAFTAEGEYIGIVSEILDRITATTGLEFERLPSGTWAKALDMAARGKVDVISGDLADEFIRRTHQFSAPYLERPLSVVMRGSDQPLVSSLYEIAGKKIAVIKGYGYTWELFNKYPDLEFIEVDNVQEGLNGVNEGRLDAFVATGLLNRYHINNMGLNELHIVGQIPIVMRVGLAARKEWPELRSIINKAIASIPERERYALVQRWMQRHYEVVVDYRRITMVILIAAAALLLTLLWNHSIRRQKERLRLSEERLQTLNKRFSLATEAVSLGVWERVMDESDRFIFDDRMFEIYGMEKQDSIPYEAWLERVHPDDRQSLINITNRLLATGGDEHIDFRAFRVDGTLRYLYAAITVIKGKGGEPDQLIGVNCDITERKQADEQFKALINALPIAIIVANADGVIRLSNPQAVREIGCDTSLVGRYTHEFYVDKNDPDEILSILLDKGQVVGRQVKYRIHSGEIIDGLLSLIPVHFYGQSALLEVVVNLTERIKIEQALAVAKEQAEQANRFKSEFLANMSHEIRTPMNAIVGLGHLLARTLLNPKQQDYVDKVQRSAQSLLGIIDDILDFSKIEAGQLKIEQIEFSLDDVLANLTTLANSRIEDKPVEFVYRIGTGVPLRLLGDPHRLGQILTNLIGNAIKFTERGHILVSVAVEQQDAPVRLKFAVEDTGIGVPSEKVDALFDPFTQADGSTTRRYGGTGLGLSICRQLTELMGGSISAESEPGKGSRFQFTLPFEIGEQTDLPRPAPDLRGMQVLVVDDNPTMRQALADMLRSLSFRVDVASSGAAALAELQAADQTYDLVLLDWRMPQMDGDEVARRIRAQTDGHRAPTIILMTVYGREAMEQQIDREDLDGFLVKPFTPSQLLDAIAEAKGSRESNVLPATRLIVEAPHERPLSGLILLAEDNAINQQVAREILEQMGLTVEVCENGTEAVASVKRRRPDLVLMDIQMPDMDGYEATRRIRRIDGAGSLPIIAMTAHAMVGDAERTMQAGMNGHITKPVDPDVLYDSLKVWLREAVVNRPEDTKKPTSAPQKTMDWDAELAGIDLQNGLKHMGSNRSLYAKLLREFLNNHGDAPQSLQQYLADNNLEAAQRLVHTLRGVAGTVGAFNLEQAAGSIDDSLRTGTPVNAGQVESFIEAWDELSRSLTEWLPPPSS